MALPSFSDRIEILLMTTRQPQSSNAIPSTTTARPDAALIRDLEAAHLHPLWDRYQRITPPAPKAKDSPRLWAWRDFEPFVERAAREVPIEDVERRAIIMAHPAFGGATVTTSNLLSAFTVLQPGDKAVPHRHTAAAIRFSTQAEGAVTIVNGRRCEMLPGDLVLTPPMCWHGHINQSSQRTVWFDAANMPLICALDGNFFEPGSRQDERFWEVDAGDERHYQSGGFLPVTSAADTASRHSAAAASHSDKYRYPGEETRRLLAALPQSADGSRTLRYTNPRTGGAVMPILDCYASRLTRGSASRARRSTWNTICLVVSGEGRSQIGEQRIEWQQHDVFTIPHWNWASHEALSAEADLFMVTDRALYDALGLSRSEIE